MVRVSERVVRERIAMLFDQASESYDDPERARSYVRRACAIAERETVSLRTEQRMRFCDACKMVLVPGETARIRLSNDNIVITCQSCGEIARFGYRG